MKVHIKKMIMICYPLKEGAVIRTKDIREKKTYNGIVKTKKNIALAISLAM